MAALGPVRRRLLVKVLELNGFAQVPGRGKGSHSWFSRPDDPELHTTVPEHDLIGTDLLQRILRQAGKSRQEYLDRLREV